MSDQPKRILVIYHSADFDGIFSREIARLHFGENADYLGWNYGDAVPVIPPEVEQLYMIDISIKGLMDHPKLIWIDHHKTAMEEFAATIPGYRIDGVAACRLAWQFFAMLDTTDGQLAKQACFGGEGEDGWFLPTKDQYVRRVVTEPLAVRLAGEYDIWDKRDPRAELFQHALRLPRVEIPPLLADHEEDEPGAGEVRIQGLLARAEDVAYVQKQKDEHHIKKSGFDLKWEGLMFLACNASGYNSLLFTAGVKEHHEALLGFRWDGGKWLVSLYGAPHRPDIDLSAIAKRHGGGGHRQACGFECAVLPFLRGSTALPEAFLRGQENHVNTLHVALGRLGAPEDTQRALTESGDVDHVHWWLSSVAHPDTARLDWLEKSFSPAFSHDLEGPEVELTVLHGNRNDMGRDALAAADSVRGAIDAAIAKGGA